MAYPLRQKEEERGGTRAMRRSQHLLLSAARRAHTQHTHTHTAEHIPFGLGDASELGVGETDPAGETAYMPGGTAA